MSRTLHFYAKSEPSDINLQLGLISSIFIETDRISDNEADYLDFPQSIVYEEGDTYTFPKMATPLTHTDGCRTVNWLPYNPIDKVYEECFILDYDSTLDVYHEGDTVTFDDVKYKVYMCYKPITVPRKFHRSKVHKGYIGYTDKGLVTKQEWDEYGNRHGYNALATKINNQAYKNYLALYVEHDVSAIDFDKTEELNKEAREWVKKYSHLPEADWLVEGIDGLESEAALWGAGLYWYAFRYLALIKANQDAANLQTIYNNQGAASFAYYLSLNGDLTEQRALSLLKQFNETYAEALIYYLCICYSYYYHNKIRYDYELPACTKYTNPYYFYGFYDGQGSIIKDGYLIMPTTETYKTAGFKYYTYITGKDTKKRKLNLKTTGTEFTGTALCIPINVFDETKTMGIKTVNFVVEECRDGDGTTALTQHQLMYFELSAESVEEE